MKVKQPVLVKGTSHVYTKRPLVTGGGRIKTIVSLHYT